MTTFKVDARTFSSVRDLNGIPSRTMQNLHHTYKMYVEKTNEILQRMPQADIQAAHPLFSDLRYYKTTLPELLGAVRSYECFFSVLGGKGGQPTGTLLDLIQRDFGGFDSFIQELKATALTSRGWVALGYDLVAQRLFLHLSDGPGAPPAWSTIPLLVLDVSEQACGTDFAGNRMRWIEACLSNLDWNRVAENLTTVPQGQKAYA